MTSQICLLHLLLQFSALVRSDGVLEFKLVSFFDMDRRILSPRGPECCSPSPNDNITGLCENSCMNRIVSCRLHYLSESDPGCDSRADDVGQSLPRSLPVFSTQPDASEYRDDPTVMHEHYFPPGTKFNFPFSGAWKNESFEVEFTVFQSSTTSELALFAWKQLDALALAERDSSRVLISSINSLRPDRWLAMRARVKCDDYYWLLNCSVYCKPTDDDSGHYTCDPDGNKKCLGGYIDPSNDCVKLIPYCDSNPCQHNGTCGEVRWGFNCDCVYGYNGVFCGNETDYCLSNPCQNEATCAALFGSYVCECAPGYTGVSCETEIDFCLSNPCLHDGTCRGHVNGYTCECLSPYRGDHCEQEINFCSSNPCQQGGTCYRNSEGYTCRCLEGTMGTNCEEQITDCSSNPCKNGGTCIPKPEKGYTCTCPENYPGLHCYGCTVKGSVFGVALVIVAVLLLTR